MDHVTLTGMDETWTEYKFKSDFERIEVLSPNNAQDLNPDLIYLQKI